MRHKDIFPGRQAFLTLLLLCFFSHLASSRRSLGTLLDMTEPLETPNWHLSAPQWDAAVSRAQTRPDTLADGAFVRAEFGNGTKQADLIFFATTRNKPLGWGYPFLEDIPQTRTRGALVGRAWRDANTGQVAFEVTLAAAAQSLAADYESGASDFDFVTYEQAVEQAVRGAPSDLAWLHTEFGRLAVLSVE